MTKVEGTRSGLAKKSLVATPMSRRALMRGGIGAADASFLTLGGKDASAATLLRTSFTPRSLQTPVAATDTIDVYPLPDTRTASPGTEITFRGITADEIGVVTVTGSGSGAHSGILVAHSDGNGVSFVPDAPFRAEETVTVEANAPLGVGGDQSFTFIVGRPISASKVQTASDDTQPDTKPISYHTRPDLKPLPIEITDTSSSVAPGFVFVGARFPHGQAGPLILDNDGEPVWFSPLGGDVLQANAFRIQQYQGKSVLTWCEGVLGQGYGLGHFVIMDDTYQVITKFKVANGYPGGDVHDFLITPENTAIILVYSRVQWDTTSIDGEAEDNVMDNILQEIDIPTGRVLFEWHSLDQIGLDESIQALPARDSDNYDFFHLNSADVDSDGNLVISARHTNAIYGLDRRSGEVLWRLGGKHSDFTMGDDTDFSFQHDARTHANGQISLFDNANNSPQSTVPSRGMVLDLDTTTMTATLARKVVHPTEIASSSQGNFQLLDNGNAFVGWGSAPVFSEFDANGELIFNGRFPKGITSYRAHRFPWTAQPADDPAIAVEAGSASKVNVYASWNGATEVATWRVLAGASADQLDEVGDAPRSGFETAITVETDQPYFAVRAEDSAGKALGNSKATKIKE